MPAQPPSQHNASHQYNQTSSQAGAGRTSIDRDGSALQPLNGTSSRNLGASALSFAPRGSSLNPTVGPGSFSSELRSQMMSSRAGSRMDVGSMYTGSIMDKVEEDGTDAAMQQALSALRDRLNREMKIKEGSENMLEALNIKKAKQTKEQRQRVEAELSASNTRIKELRQKISEAQRTKAPPPTTPTRNRTQEAVAQPTGLRSSPSVSRSVAGSEVDESAESPTFALAELLQALEVEGMTPEYYVSRANQLVDLFKRHPALKYDLVWAIFGLRMQMMLLSESREVVAAGYRVARYAISDAPSIKKIRKFNTDFLVVRYVGFIYFGS